MKEWLSRLEMLELQEARKEVVRLVLDRHCWSLREKDLRSSSQMTTALVVMTFWRACRGVIKERPGIL